MSLEQEIKNQWNIKELAAALASETWRITEPKRIDRMTWIGTSSAIQEMAEQAYSQKEWEEAEEHYYTNELLWDYLDVLALLVKEEMGEHVYATFEDDEAFLGQYEDGDLAELEAEGYVIED